MDSKRGGGLLGLLGLLLFAAPERSVAQGVDSPPRADARAAPEAVIKLVPHRTRWAVDVQIGGRPFRFGLDTGGGLTLISPAAARAAGCTPWGRLSGFQMMGQRIDSPRCDSVTIHVGRLQLRPEVTGVVELEKFEPNDRDLAGSLALDAFGARALTLDLGAGSIVVESPASLAERIRTMTPLPIRVDREASGRALELFTAVRTSQGPLWMELDSGNGGTILVSKPYAALVGLDSTARGPQTGGFELVAGMPVRSDRIFTPDMIIEGNLGMPFLRHWILTVDLAMGRAWIAPVPVH
jgi:hypothetical protein